MTATLHWLQFLTAVLRRRYLVVACAVAGLLMAVTATVMRGDQYAAKSWYQPHISPYVRAGSQLTLTLPARQFGVLIPYGEAGEGPAFYEVLVTSPVILTDVARASYRFAVGMDGGDSLEGCLADLLEIDGATEFERTHRLVERLERAVSADMDMVTGIVTVTTRAPWPGLAEQMNRRILELIQDFIYRKRRDRVGAVAEFAGERLEVAAAELTAAESALAQFYDRNRRFRDSPRLMTEEQRLRDDLEQRIQIYESLILAHDQARIENLRDTPFITVIDAPEGSAERVGLQLPAAVLLGFVIGGLLGLALAVPVDRVADVRKRLRDRTVVGGAVAALVCWLSACDDGVGPEGTILIEVEGRAERSAVVSLSASIEGRLVPDSAVSWSASPADAVTFLPQGQARLLRATRVTLLATSANESGQLTLDVLVPPTVVFDLLVGGNRDIYSTALDGLDVVRLTTHPGEDVYPAVAGSAVVFVSYRDGNGELYRTTLTGGAPERLTNTADAEAVPALSPSGGLVAYTRSVSGVPKLWIGGSDGGSAARVTETFGYAGSIETSPCWDPDGERVAFVSTHLGSSDIWVYTVSGEDFAPLVPDSGSRAEVEPAWSPGGERLAFVTNRTGDTEIYFLELSTGTLTRITDRVGADGQPTWTSDGRLVFVAWVDNMPQLRWLDPAESDSTYHIDVGPGQPGHPAGVLQ